MDPITIAMTSFTALKAGIKAGKELHSLIGDVGKMWDAIDSINKDHSKTKVSKLGVNEEALSTFVAKKKAEDLENELKTIILYTRGMSGWDELQRLRAQIRKERLAEAKRLSALKKKRIVQGLITLTVLLGLGIVSTILYTVYLRFTP